MLTARFLAETLMAILISEASPNTPQLAGPHCCHAQTHLCVPSHCMYSQKTEGMHLLLISNAVEPTHVGIDRYF